jgi:hypothetical protein
MALLLIKYASSIQLMPTQVFLHIDNLKLLYKVSYLSVSLSIYLIHEIISVTSVLIDLKILLYIA